MSEVTVAYCMMIIISLMMLGPVIFNKDNEK